MVYSKILRADDRSHGITDQERVDRHAALLEEIVAKVAHEDTSLAEIHAILDEVAVCWRMDISSAINRICGAACSNVTVDAEAWMSLVWRMVFWGEEGSDKALAQAFTHPLLSLFLETHAFTQEDQTILCDGLGTAYLVKSDEHLLNKHFFNAIDSWRKKSNCPKEMGRKIAAAKRDKSKYSRKEKIRIRILNQMLLLSGDTLVQRLRALVSFDEVLSRLSKQQLDPKDPAPKELRRCYSLDQVRTLLEGA